MRCKGVGRGEGLCVLPMTWQTHHAAAICGVQLPVREPALGICHNLLQLSPLAVQVRQLQTLGFPIKRDILAEVDTAGRFYRHGLVLKQVANFYNDIATQIIPCQKPMLLAVSCLGVCVVVSCSCIMSASDLSTQAACMRLV